MYLLDTNVVSELRKIPKDKADKNLFDWSNSVDKNLFFINHVVLFELQKWILRTERKDKQQAIVLKQWLNAFLLGFHNKNRILPITEEIFLACAKLHVPNPRPAFDSLIAATALVHDFTLVTRNVADFDNISELRIFNPFTD